jgi:hypothetical protein
MEEELLMKTQLLFMYDMKFFGGNYALAYLKELPAAISGS